MGGPSREALGAHGTTYHISTEEDFSTAVMIAEKLASLIRVIHKDRHGHWYDVQVGHLLLVSVHFTAAIAVPKPRPEP